MIARGTLTGSRWRRSTGSSWPAINRTGSSVNNAIMTGLRNQSFTLKKVFLDRNFICFKYRIHEVEKYFRDKRVF